jgi:hypothetical protein
MAKIWLDWSDGHYSTRLLTDEEAAKREALDLDVTYVEERVLEAWHRHCDAEGAWQAMWRAISNEQSMRRREKELLPREEAVREIERLKDELARAKRMEKFYEERYALQLGERHRAEYAAYTCVFPQPGCDVAVLPAEWQDDAQGILEHYDVDRAAKAQGCCCGHAHRKLDAATQAQLRAAGFLIGFEHDAGVV